MLRLALLFFFSSSAVPLLQRFRGMSWPRHGTNSAASIAVLAVPIRSTHADSSISAFMTDKPDSLIFLSSTPWRFC